MIAEVIETHVEEDFTRPVDPLFFIRNLSQVFGIKFRRDLKDDDECCPVFLNYKGYTAPRYRAMRPYNLAISHFAQNPRLNNFSCFGKNRDYRPPGPLFNFMYRGSRLNGITLKDFDFRKGDFDFGEWQKYFGVRIVYNIINTPNVLSEHLDFEIGMDVLGGYILKHRHPYLENESPNCRKTIRKFADIDALPNPDFRPYVHRTMEIYLQIPQDQWHDPSIYSAEATEINAFVDRTVETLFSGEERGELEAQIAEARLKMRQGWASVPTMNLGTIVLPTPGQQDISQDEFVVSGASYIVEYLHQLGIMDKKEAEAMMAQKLTNYFLQRTEFQLSRDRAGKIVDQLRSGL